MTAQVLFSKAKTVNGLKNVIKQKLASYRQPNSEEQVNLVIKWLKNQGFIKQNGQIICYPTSDDMKVNKSEVSVKNKSSSTLYQHVIALIKQRAISARPSKKSSLINYLKSHLRNEDSKVIDNLVKQMINNKVIVISTTNKLSYNI